MTLYKHMNNGWWKLCKDKKRGEHWQNGAGGWHSYSKNDLKEYPIAEGKTWPKNKRELNLGLLEDTIENGWLSKRGWFYGCRYACHDAVAECVLMKDVHELELEGWIRIHTNVAQFYLENVDIKAKPTKAQIKTMEEIGFFDASESYFIRRHIPKFEEVKERIKINQFVGESG